MARLARPLGLLLALPLWLGGCLLPQPDTPPIPPFAGAPAASRAGAPNKAATSPQPAASGLISNNAGGTVDNNAGGIVSTGAATDAGGGTRSAAPTAPGTEPGFNAGTTTAMTPGTTEAAAPGRLAVRFRGDDVTEVWVVPVGSGSGAGAPVVDDRFTLDLPAGEYILELVVGAKRLRTTKPVAVPAGGERSLEVTVEADAITITESLPLEDTAVKAPPGPSASPSPEATATP